MILTPHCSRLMGIRKAKVLITKTHGYHPLLCYDGLTGDLLRVQLRDGIDYCSKNSAGLTKPLIAEYRENYPIVRLYARGDSGFATPELYDLSLKYSAIYGHLQCSWNKKVGTLTLEKS